MDNRSDIFIVIISVMCYTLTNALNKYFLLKISFNIFLFFALIHGFPKFGLVFPVFVR
jgi:hypothetical protein